MAPEIFSKSRTASGRCASLSARTIGTLMIAGAEGVIRYFDVTSGLEVTSYPILAAAFSQDGSRVASMGAIRLASKEEHAPARTLKIFDTANGRELLVITNLSGPPTLFSFALSPDGKRVAAGFAEMVSESPDDSTTWAQVEQGSVVIWDVSTGREVLRHRLTRTGPMDLDFSPDGRQLAVACAECARMVVVLITQEGGGGADVHMAHPGKIVILNVVSGEEVVSLCGHRHDVAAIAFIDRGCRLVSASSDRTVRLWKIGTSRIIPLGGPRVEDWDDPISRLQSLTPLSSDGRMIAVSTSDRNWDVVDLFTGKSLGSARIPTSERMQAAVFTKSPPGLVCLSGSALHCFDLAAGQSRGPSASPT